MTKHVKTPNLPQNNVNTALCGKVTSETENALKELGIELIKLDESVLLGENLSNHADLQCIHIGNNKILLSAEQSKVKEKLDLLGFDVTLFDGLGREYPSDCLVNAAIVGKNIICKSGIIHPAVIKDATENGLNIIETNQGYTKCSVCVVDEKSVITEDESIKNACENRGIDVLLIRKGFVKLEGFDYGFIGGASFKLNSNTLVFNGKVENHPDYFVIKSFLKNKNINCISIGEYCLTDIGGIIPIAEY